MKELEGHHIISFDPGRINCGISVLKVRKKGEVIECRVLYNGILKNSNIIMKNPMYKKCIIDIIYEIDGFIEKYRPLFISLERYQSRGKMVGTTSEAVISMIGALQMHLSNEHPNVELYLHTAAIWKNAVNRIFDLKDMYKHCRSTPHVIDATLIGLYSMYKICELEPFKGLKSAKSRLKLIKAIEVTTTDSLRNIRYKIKDYT